MGINLLDLIKRQVTSAAIGKVAELVGLDEAKTESALGGVVPAVLGGYVQESSTPTGLGRLTKALDLGGDSLLGDIAGLLGGDKSQLRDIGGKLFASLFGSREKKVTDALGRSTGAGSTIVSALLKIAAPMVLSFIAKQRKARKLDERGLGDLL